MKLEDRMRELLRFKHYSLRTEEAYVGWYRQFVKFHKLRHPEEMGKAEVEAFLTHLAVNRRVVAATQNQALNALVFLFREVLGRPFDGVDAMRAQQSKRLPVVLSVEEMRKLLMVMTGEEAVMAKLLYGWEEEPGHPSSGSPSVARSLLVDSLSPNENHPIPSGRNPWVSLFFYGCPCFFRKIFQPQWERSGHGRTG